MDSEESDNKQQDTSPVSGPEVLDSSLQRPTPEQIQHNADAEALKTFERLTLKYQKGTLGVAVIVAAITAVYASFSYLQWQALQDANQRTDTIIQNNIASIRATKKMIDTAKTSADAAQDQAILARQQFAIAKKEFELANHALIGFDQILPANLALDATKLPMRLLVVFANAGRGPAKEVRIKVAARFATGNPRDQDFAFMEFGTIPAILPGHTANVEFQVDDNEFNRDWIKKVLTGGSDWYLRFICEYTDLIGPQEPVDVTLIYNRGFQTWAFAPHPKSK